jgi:hypothetical protein
MLGSLNPNLSKTKSKELAQYLDGSIGSFCHTFNHFYSEHMFLFDTSLTQSENPTTSSTKLLSDSIFSKALRANAQAIALSNISQDNSQNTFDHSQSTHKESRSNNSNKESSSLHRCGLCGKTHKLTKTECCNQWICDDADQYQLFSYANNSCYRNHDRYTLCASHYHEGHPGDWKDCPLCREGINTEMYVWYGTNEYNFEKLPNPPAFKPTKCAKCGRIIHLGEDGYTSQGDKYFCMNCKKLF